MHFWTIYDFIEMIGKAGSRSPWEGGSTPWMQGFKSPMVVDA
jgi:hypothetical protein